MSPERFLAAFDPDQWMQAEEIAERLDKADYWQPCWPPLSRQEKIGYVARVCRTWKTEDRVPMIAARECQVYPGQLGYMYKPTDALTPEDYRDLLCIHHERLVGPEMPPMPSMEDDEVPF